MDINEFDSLVKGKGYVWAPRAREAVTLLELCNNLIDRIDEIYFFEPEAILHSEDEAKKVLLAITLLSKRTAKEFIRIAAELPEDDEQAERDLVSVRNYCKDAKILAMAIDLDNLSAPYINPITNKKIEDGEPEKIKLIILKGLSLFVRCMLWRLMKETGESLLALCGSPEEEDIINLLNAETTEVINKFTEVVWDDELLYNDYFEDENALRRVSYEDYKNSDPLDSTDSEEQEENLLEWG